MKSQILFMFFLCFTFFQVRAQDGPFVKGTVEEVKVPKKFNVPGQVMYVLMPGLEIVAGLKPKDENAGRTMAMEKLSDYFTLPENSPKRKKLVVEANKALKLIEKEQKKGNSTDPKSWQTKRGLEIFRFHLSKVLNQDVFIME